MGTKSHVSSRIWSASSNILINLRITPVVSKLRCWVKMWLKSWKSSTCSREPTPNSLPKEESSRELARNQNWWQHQNKSRMSQQNWRSVQLISVANSLTTLTLPATTRLSQITRPSLSIMCLKLPMKFIVSHSANLRTKWTAWRKPPANIRFYLTEKESFKTTSKIWTQPSLMNKTTILKNARRLTKTSSAWRERWMSLMLRPSFTSNIWTAVSKANNLATTDYSARSRTCSRSK